MEQDPEKPRWLRDLVRFLPLKSQFVLSGNVRDLQADEVAPGAVAPMAFVPMLANALRRQQYTNVVLYDPLLGFQMHLSVDGEPAQDRTRRLQKEE